jgi:DeoR family transcriptional regulator, fructose operon transcriptional repressor
VAQEHDSQLQRQPKMKSDERQNEILALLMAKTEVKFSEMSKFFGVTEMTIRRDIERLEAKGLVLRTFGGAIMAPSRDTAVKDRKALMISEKERIGKAAASLIGHDEAIFIDAGTTTAEIARNIHQRSITVVTNAPQHAIDLQERSIPTILLGGHLHESTISLVGPITEENLRKMSFDRVFIAATGVSVSVGFSNSNIFEIPIKKLAMSQAKEINIVLDSSKFEVDSLAQITNFAQVDRLITDCEPPKRILEACQNNRVEVMVARD